MREPVIQPNELALMDRFNIMKYGDTVENLLAKLEEKAKQERENAIMNLYHNLNLSTLQIADALKIEEEQVNVIIKKNIEK